MCKWCYTRTSREKNECPFCKLTPWQTRNYTNVEKAMISTFKFQCVETSCPSSGVEFAYEAMVSHLISHSKDNIEYACPFDCGFTTKVSLMDDHFIDIVVENQIHQKNSADITCEKQKVICKKCNITVNLNQINKHGCYGSDLIDKLKEERELNSTQLQSSLLDALEGAGNVKRQRTSSQDTIEQMKRASEPPLLNYDRCDLVKVVQNDMHINNEAFLVRYLKYTTIVGQRNSELVNTLEQLQRQIHQKNFNVYESVNPDDSNKNYISVDYFSNRFVLQEVKRELPGNFVFYCPVQMTDCNYKEHMQNYKSDMGV